ncbi:MAG: RhuM family protein [Legionellaceae bacterium]|nr:RhuM family protein [Legionellaceae bacterium]
MTNNPLIYQAKDGSLKLDVSLETDTIWLTQKQMADLFKKDVRTINEHIQNIYIEEELVQKSTIRKFRIVRCEGNREVARDIEHYNLDVIISIGYRVKSNEGTRFRVWANKVLKEYLVRGYTLDQKRLKKQSHEIQELQKTISLFQQAQSKDLGQSEAIGLLNILTDYTHSMIDFFVIDNLITLSIAN